jgi:hypothetical protein
MGGAMVGYGRLPHRFSFGFAVASESGLQRLGGCVVGPSMGSDPLVAAAQEGDRVSQESERKRTAE